MPRTLPKETVEVIELEVKVNGIATDDYEVTWLDFGDDLTTDGDWHAPDTAGAKTGILLDGTMDAGRYWVFVRHQDFPEVPVRLTDYVLLT